MTTEKNGYIYFLINQSMPGLVKVGHTTRTPEKRLQELDTTSVPTPFKIGAAFAVIEPEKCESSIHEELKEKRENKGREFFRIELFQAIEQVFPIIKKHILIINNDASNSFPDFRNGPPGIELSEKEIEMLRAIILRNSNYDSDAVTTYQLSQKFYKLRNLELEYILSKLVDKKLIKKFDSRKESESGWKMTPSGEIDWGQV